MNVPGPSPLPLVGNLLQVIKKGITEHDTELMNQYGKIVGFFEGSTPNLMITDIRLIKSITIKDFGHFVNRRVNFLLINKCFLFNVFSILLSTKVF
jgi:hypothetical protein